MSKYVLGELLGRGGMAHVFKAQDTVLRREVALKILQDNRVNDPDFVNRFRREARAAASLTHPNIAHVYEVGDMDCRPYIAMELVQGKTLEDMLSTSPLSVDEGCRILHGILSGISFAHSHGIIHRDIKPSNIMVSDDGTVKITDFGIAKIVDSMPQTTLTRNAEILGTPQYMSPEQVNQGEISGKSDIFSVGIVAYKIFTGILPFDNQSQESKTHMMYNIINKSLVVPRKLNSSLDKSLEDMILKALDRDLTNRYDAQGFLHDLEQYVSNGKVNVTGSWFRRSRINRREFILKSIAISSGGAIAASFSAAAISQYLDYQGSLKEVVNHVSQEGTNSNRWHLMMANLYERINERFYWIFNQELLPHIESQKNQERPTIYPFGSANGPGREGTFFYYTGEGSAAGYVAPMVALAAEKYSRTKNSNDTKISQQMLQAFLTYTQNLYWAENDETGLNMDRFYYPVIFASNNTSIPEGVRKKVMENYELAVKMIVEKRFNTHKGFIDRSDSNTQFNKLPPDVQKDFRVSWALCNSPKYLDLKSLLPAGPLKSVEDFINMIISDADAKIKHIVEKDGETGLRSQDHTSFIIGLFSRADMIKEIISREQPNFVTNTKDFSTSYLEHLSSVEKKYRNTADLMVKRAIRPESFLTYSKKENQVDNISTIRLLDVATTRYPELAKSIVHALCKGGYICTENDVPPTIEHPMGLVKGTCFNLLDMKGMTYIETDYLFMKNLNLMLKK